MKTNYEKMFPISGKVRKVKKTSSGMNNCASDMKMCTGFKIAQQDTKNGEFLQSQNGIFSDCYHNSLKKMYVVSPRKAQQDANICFKEF